MYFIYFYFNEGPTVKRGSKKEDLAPGKLMLPSV
jgi:hypothetical protein